jgi:RNA polymerase sigma-70 factor (ECF subfamily)
VSQAVVPALDVDADADVASAYESYRLDLRGYAASVTRDPVAAEDLVQESFVRLLGERQQGRSPTNVRAWLFTVCTNIVRSRARHRSIADRVGRLLARDLHEEVDEAAEHTVVRRERESELLAAIQALPTEHRLALLLTAHGFSGPEVARILGRSEGATRNILWRSRLTVRDRLANGASE